MARIYVYRIWEARIVLELVYEDHVYWYNIWAIKA